MGYLSLRRYYLMPILCRDPLPLPLSNLYKVLVKNFSWFLSSVKSSKYLISQISQSSSSEFLSSVISGENKIYSLTKIQIFRSLYICSLLGLKYIAHYIHSHYVDWISLISHMPIEFFFAFLVFTISLFYSCLIIK